MTDTPRDLAHDHLVLVGGGGPSIYAKIESPYAMVNGRVTPEPLRLTAGEVHRIRIVSIHPDWRISISLRNDSTVARWRAIAKGWPRPAACAGHGTIREPRDGPRRDGRLRDSTIRAGYGGSRSGRSSRAGTSRCRSLSWRRRNQADDVGSSALTYDHDASEA